jgi:uncharacterized protein
MSDRKPLMPKATAVWLVEHTALTFEQVATFCGLHVLEVKGIADGDVAMGIQGRDPIIAGQLTVDEIARAEKDGTHVLEIAPLKVAISPSSAKGKRGPRYTPVSRRHDRPNAVLWLIRNHPELKDSQLMRLVGTTKPTIAQIRDRSHWNSANLTPQDPVALGLCSQIDLDAEVRKGAKRADKNAGPEMEKGGSLLPTGETAGELGSPRPTASILQPKAAEEPRAETEAEEQARVLAKLKGLKSDTPDDE